MAATTIQAAEGRRALTIRAAVGRYLGWVVVAGFGAWFLWNLIEAPTQVITVMIDGLNNGALYALVALGYTLVYGIIELINFAHGDLFMLGTIFASYFMVKWLGLESASAMGWLALVVGIIGTAIFCAVLNVGAERFAYRRLSVPPSSRRSSPPSE